MKERSLLALYLDTISRLLGRIQRRLNSMFIFTQPENALILMGEKHRSIFSLNTCMTPESSPEEESEDE